MAFITSAPVQTTKRGRQPNALTPKYPPSNSRAVKHGASKSIHATAVQPNRPETKAEPAMWQRQRTKAPVIDSRVASRFEAHHWIVVMNQSRRLFERAAVAQADLTRQLEANQGPNNKALHRWVLREIHSHPWKDSSATVMNPNTSRYLVTESFDRQAWESSSASITKRWLSAVERVGPLISSTIDIRSLKYSDVFTSKKHDVTFDPSKNIVVLHCLNIKQNDSRTAESVISALKAKAERSVGLGTCLEFCVLQSQTKPSLFKTIEIFSDMDAMVEFANGADKLFQHSIMPHIVDGRQGRYVFKPIVFS